MATKARLQRRLQAKQKAAEDADVPLECPTDGFTAEDWKGMLKNLGLSNAELDAADACGRSLVEELTPPGIAEAIVKGFPESWSFRRVLAVYAKSSHPKMQQMWAGFVKDSCLRAYYLERDSELLDRWEQNPGLRITDLLQERCAVEWAKMSLSNRILMAIFGHLNLWDCLGLVLLVCRRWHFVARCVWNRIERLQVDAIKAPFSPAALLKPSQIVFRMQMLTSVTLCGGICVPVVNLPSIFKRTSWPPVSTLRVLDVTFVSSTISLKDANEEVCSFLQNRVLLKELMLVDVNVCFLGMARNRREISCLDLFYFEFSHSKLGKPLPLENLQLSVKMLQRFTDNFKIFCKQVLQRNVKATVFCGGITPNYAAGLLESSFAQGFALLMPHLREISLCNLSFVDGNRLAASSLDLLSSQIRRNSNLELFCLVNAEISEDAICNLQRCANLQVLVLLRCSIISKDRDLRTMAGWHPNANLPSSLITDDVTVPRWLKPTYFRVVRVDQLTEFSGNKFVNLRNRYWSIRALLQSAELGLQDFCFPSLYLAPEEIFGDAVWLQG